MSSSRPFYHWVMTSSHTHTHTQHADIPLFHRSSFCFNSHEHKQLLNPWKHKIRVKICLNRSAPLKKSGYFSVKIGKKQKRWALPILYYTILYYTIHTLLTLTCLPRRAGGAGGRGSACRPHTLGAVGQWEASAQTPHGAQLAHAQHPRAVGGGGQPGARRQRRPYMEN